MIDCSCTSEIQNEIGLHLADRFCQMKGGLHFSDPRTDVIRLYIGPLYLYKFALNGIRY